MLTIEQCRTFAAEYKTVLLGISRSWTALAHQLENLMAIVKDEGRKPPQLPVLNDIEWASKSRRHFRSAAIRVRKLLADPEIFRGCLAPVFRLFIA
jgi:hypothetical protein